MAMVEVRLLIINGWIYILAGDKMSKLSNRQLRYGGIPRTIMEYAIFEFPNEIFTVFHLEDYGIKTSRDFRQIAYSAGFRGLVKKYFLPFCMKEGLEIIDKIIIKSNDVKSLFDDIEQRKTVHI